MYNDSGIEKRHGSCGAMTQSNVIPGDWNRRLSFQIHRAEFRMSSTSLNPTAFGFTIMAPSFIALLATSSKS